MVVDGFKALLSSRLVAKLLLTADTPGVLWLQASMLIDRKRRTVAVWCVGQVPIVTAALDNLKQ